MRTDKSLKFPTVGKFDKRPQQHPLKAPQKPVNARFFNMLRGKVYTRKTDAQNPRRRHKNRNENARKVDLKKGIKCTPTQGGTHDGERMAH